MKEITITRTIFETGDIIRRKPSETSGGRWAIVYHTRVKKDGNVTYKVIQDDRTSRIWHQYDVSDYELVGHVDLREVFREEKKDESAGNHRESGAGS